jgi:hypothetical protein
MTGQRIGYKRVSTIDQNTTRQLFEIPIDKSFEDKASGKDTQRPQLQCALAYCREGDTLVVHSMDRLARSLVDMRKTCERPYRSRSGCGVRQGGPSFHGRRFADGHSAGYNEMPPPRATLPPLAVPKCCISLLA